MNEEKETRCHRPKSFHFAKINYRASNIAMSEMNLPIDHDYILSLLKKVQSETNSLSLFENDPEKPKYQNIVELSKLNST